MDELYKWVSDASGKWTAAGICTKTCSVLTGIAIYLIGGESNAIVETALMFMATDITLGVLAAMYRGEFSSTEMRHGLLRKIAFVVAIVMSHTMDVWLGSGTYIKRFICSSISGYEFLSNVETLAMMKIKVFPLWLIKRFKGVTQGDLENALDILEKRIIQSDRRISRATPEELGFPDRRTSATDRRTTNDERTTNDRPSSE